MSDRQKTLACHFDEIVIAKTGITFKLSGEMMYWRELPVAAGDDVVSVLISGLVDVNLSEG